MRLAKGLTQEDFALESGRIYVSELERGLKQPTLQKIDELSEPLSVHPLTPLVLSYLTKYEPAAVEKLFARIKQEIQELFPNGRPG